MSILICYYIDLQKNFPAAGIFVMCDTAPLIQPNTVNNILIHLNKFLINKNSSLAVILVPGTVKPQNNAHVNILGSIMIAAFFFCIDSVL